MIEIRPERPQDCAGSDAVERAAFPSDGEARLVTQLRGAPGVSSWVACDGEQVVGHVLYTPLRWEADPDTVVPPGPLIALGPMAVLPDRQGRGIGTRLIEASLSAGRENGWSAAIVLGHPGYYPRFGFRPAVEYSVRSTYSVPPEVFMAQELIPGTFRGAAGVVHYDPAFDELE